MEKYKTHEVEYRACLINAQKRSIVSKLKRIKALFIGEDEITDIYFCHKSVKKFDEVEMDALGSYSLRLRKKINRAETKITLNVKIITRAGDHNSWKEYEIAIDSLKEAENILIAIGFKPFFRVKKKRMNFKKKSINILLEDIKNFGTVIEIETFATYNSTPEAKIKILKILKALGIKSKQVVPKSITNILMKRSACF